MDPRGIYASERPKSLGKVGEVRPCDSQKMASCIVKKKKKENN